MIKKNLGGERLGSGNKMKVELQNFERSTHDLGYLFRTTMSAGTLVPFMSEVALPGDTFDINLNADVKTHPTVAPLFGSFKFQADVFVVPMRLYLSYLHNNKLGIGMDMSKVKIPQLKLTADKFTGLEDDPSNAQIEPSTLLSYLDIRGLGQAYTTGYDKVTRYFNALPYISYWDIYKNYYANKMEEIGVMIHNRLWGNDEDLIRCYVVDDSLTENNIEKGNVNSYLFSIINGSYIDFEFNSTAGKLTSNYFIVYNDGSIQSIDNILTDPNWTLTTGINDFRLTWSGGANFLDIKGYVTSIGLDQSKIELVSFPLENIDKMREDLQSDFSGTPFIIDKNSIEPFNSGPNEFNGYYSKLFSQDGLGIKTYQSDLFNNWLNTDWIDGASGINQISAINTSTGKFTIDTLNLSMKVYEMLNRIAVSGGTYDDWIEAVYAHNTSRRLTSPIYMGGLSKELIFQEVVSNASTDVDGAKPLGTLAGKGSMSSKHKGGNIYIKVDEPSYIIGICSLTPRIDYSQGNKWDVNLKTMNDLHKPNLDQIGFQSLITDQMAYFATKLDEFGNPIFKSAGKQPAWINYMTNVNKVRGNFAKGSEVVVGEMFMTLNRKYDFDVNTKDIKDLTTYIDPTKYNYVFAQTSLDAQNFWTQMAVDITARRKMSAKVIPNL